MSSTGEQIFIGVVATVGGGIILIILGFIGREWLSPLWTAILRRAKRWENLLAVLLVLELIIFVVSGNLIGTIISISHIFLFCIALYFHKKSLSQGLWIISATYGKDSKTIDVTHQLQLSVINGKIYDIPVRNTIFKPDPCVGINKDLKVTYAVKLDKTVKEGETLSLP